MADKISFCTISWDADNIEIGFDIGSYGLVKVFKDLIAGKLAADIQY